MSLPSSSPYVDDTPLTAAEILRRKLNAGASSKQSEQQSTPDGEVDLDEAIRRLEAELNDDEVDASHDDEEDEDKTSQRNHKEGPSSVAKPMRAGESSAQPGVLCLSILREDARIEHLPAQYLPSNKRRILRNIDGEDTTTSSKMNDEKKIKLGSGLESAVKELLANYRPRSAERLPFYCRVCCVQFDNHDDFFQHRETEEHEKAVQIERKASYCKLCHKQFTSPAQLKEHLQSKPHKERWQRLRARRLQPSL